MLVALLAFHGEVEVTAAREVGARSEHHAGVGACGGRRQRRPEQEVVGDKGGLVGKEQIHTPAAHRALGGGHRADLGAVVEGDELGLLVDHGARQKV